MSEKTPPTSLIAQLNALLPQCMQNDALHIERKMRQKRRLPAGQLERLVKRARSSSELLEKRRAHVPEPRYPSSLPIAGRRTEILQAIRDNPVVIIAGETGSGKTTQLPKMCLEAGCGIRGKIAVTQPRRVAALSIARRIAEELELEYGRHIGCKIRFRDQTSPETFIKVMTDGMLLAETQGDRDLSEYDAIVVDEAHERSLNIDFLIGYLRLLRQRRPELKIIITSATIDTETFSNAFDGAPIIEVSGRVYPVEVRYKPLDEGEQDSGECTYIDAAANAVDELLKASRQGDILVFMPSERDIRETRDKIERRRYPQTEILPLFGRLSAADQQRVFAQQDRRRVVIATNIAETSLTIPNIRYVVDTGLARVSRYNPRTHTQRLPIEAVAQSSAEQRKGRCGRVADGTCIRLYDEKDFLSRPEFAQPEIQRANLAEVILRMIDLKLGDIERFPFIDPPQKSAIAGGFQLLHALGAIDEHRRLTGRGRDMARLPIDPTVSRMILQARDEHALSEVLIIASAISVQDPRDRPLEEQEAADQMHRRFRDERSDFIAYLNIWNAYHKQMEKASQNQMRKFCKAHYLSYVRMREWRDIHAQIHQTLREIGRFSFNSEHAEYDAIHRAVLAGLLGNIAQKKEGNIYRAARGRDVMIFPGSSLFKRPQKETDSTEKEGRAPAWLVAGEIVETSRLFARTVARIHPEWLADLGSHLCRVSYDQPYWNARSGRVLVREKHVLYGLEVLSRRVDYGRINPREATEIFIREALVPADIRTRHATLESNRRLCDKLETWQTRAHHVGTVDVEDAACRFYAERLEGVSSLHDLNRFLRNRGSDFLQMSEEDILGTDDGVFDQRSFPDALDLDGQALPLSYAYKPGESEDGITVKVPYKLAHALDEEVLEWLVPGLLQEKITALLRSLPKRIRKQLVPIPDKARTIAAQLKRTHPTFVESLHEFVRTTYRIDVQLADWDADDVPDHLRMRVEIQSGNDATVAAGRDLASLKNELDQRETPAELDAWKKAADAWERRGLTQWDFGDLPERIEVAQVGGVPIYGYPGLAREEDGRAVSLCLYKKREDAERDSREGLACLCEIHLGDETAWLQRELKGLNALKDLYQSIASPQEMRERAYAHLEHYLFYRPRPLPLREADFTALLERARSAVRGLSERFLSLFEGLFKQRQELRLSGSRFAHMSTELDRLLPGDFLSHTPYEQLAQLHRYLKALQLRAERAQLDPGKEQQRAALITPYQRRLDEFWQESEASLERRALVGEYRWMLEEYRVSVFAQELGTAHPISPKRLDKKLEQIERTP